MIKEYPEHEKLKKITGKSQEIGKFLDWLRYEKRYRLCACYEYDEYEWNPIQDGIEKLLSEYFEIDLAKIEKERIELLEDLTIRG